MPPEKCKCCVVVNADDADDGIGDANGDDGDD
jgi:hypothetical protein